MPVPRRAPVAVTAALVLAGACATVDDSGPPLTPAPTSSTQSVGGTPPSEPHPPTATPAPPQRLITIAFAGDVHFEGALRALLDEPTAALAPIAAQLSAADLAVVNLESAVTTGGTREPKRFTFRAPPSAFEALAAAGVDVVSMANNHGMDFGADGLAETLTAVDDARSAEPPLEVVGIGADADAAFAPARHDIDGTIIATLAASAAALDPTADPTGHWAAGDARPGVADAVDPSRLLDAVRSARRDADVVVVYLHWGIQGESCPSDDQRSLAAAVSQAGADIVVGSHAHRLQGSGTLDGTYVAYGLGNFAWYTQASQATATTGLLTLTVDSGQVVADTWEPAVIGASGLPRFVTGAEASRMTDAFAGLRDCAGLAAL